ncbi:MAG TPA: sigma-70 family RNA polymerase sigma factor [Polyangiaceae bacterium]|jgi:RNA polymerase sigma-70 factor (ECF subfamily)|nr:sigma-70 family RNA polymerase sigma factor [Polyangiaceae bacterium]
MIASTRGAAQDLHFPAIFSEYAPYVLRVMRHLGIPSGDLQDQCQEVFVAVFRGLSSFSGRSSLRTWIYGICLRVASNHRRRAHIRRERPYSEPPEQSLPPPQHERFEQRENQASLQRLLDELDPDKREVFVLYEIEEMSMKEVAEACGCPLQTAYSRLHAARRLLLDRYRQSEGVT